LDVLADRPERARVEQQVDAPPRVELHVEAALGADVRVLEDRLAERHLPAGGVRALGPEAGGDLALLAEEQGHRPMSVLASPRGAGGGSAERRTDAFPAGRPALPL